MSFCSELQQYDGTSPTTVLSMAAVGIVLLIALQPALAWVVRPLDGVRTSENSSWTRRRSKGSGVPTQRMHMVRNIDLPEAVVFYGQNSLITSSEKDGPLVAREGLVALVEECLGIQTAVLFLLEASSLPPGALSSLLNKCDVRTTTAEPPNPLDLLSILETVTVQPRPFGGSSGFGSKPADPERCVAPQHCVVFTTTLDQTRAARAVGMRVISMDTDDPTDDPLADAVVDDYVTVGVDDIATPGSFWLNPPHPRDDDGNKVDPYDLVDEYQQWGRRAASLDPDSMVAPDSNAGTDMDEDDIQAILADLAPLR